MAEELDYNINDLFNPESLQWNGAFRSGSTPSFQNGFIDGIDPRVVGSSEQGQQLLNVGTKIREITVRVGDDLQKNLDKLELDGGGIINMNAGTHTIETNITVPNSVKILGENRDNTIIDFNSTSAHFIVAGTDAYTTGTISAIGSGGTVVTGSGTSWLANVTNKHQIFIDGRWYIIATITTDTNIILAEPYKDAATFSGTYRAVILRQDVQFRSLTIKNSTDTGIDYDDVRDIRQDDLLIIANNKGFTVDNFTFMLSSGVVVTNSTDNGYEVTNGRFFNAQPIASLGNGGHGAVLNSIKTDAWLYCANNGNALDGFNLTDVDSCAFTAEASGNGQDGIQLVSGCDDNRISIANLNANVRDGIRLLATCDNNTITTAVIRVNGEYGVNIVNANCDNNIIVSNHILGNTTDEVNDSGTGTVIRGNVGVDDNATSAPGVFAFEVSDILQQSADTERSSTLGSAEKLKEIEVNRIGAIRVKWDQKSTGGTLQTKGQVKVNGSSVGSEQIHFTNTYTTYSRDITDLLIGDLVQFDMNSFSSTSGEVKNFRLYFNVVESSETVVKLD